MNSRSRKKILLILTHTGAGGDTQAIYNLLSALSIEGLDFHILSYERGAIHDSFRQFGTVYTFPIDDMPLVRRMLRRFLLPLFVRLKKQFCHYLIEKINPDLLYVNTVNEHEFSRAAVCSDSKLIVHIHEMGFVVTQRIQTAWIEQLLARAHTIISPAQAVSEFYKDVYGIDPAKMMVIHETASESRLQQQSGSPDLRQQLNIGADTILIGSVGSVIYRKGVDTFIKACGILKEKLPEQSFLFLWLGGQSPSTNKQPYLKSLESSIERSGLSAHFQFLPYTSDVSDFYAQLDIFVLPSRMEAFPLVVLEALLKEKPVVAMDVAGVREVIDGQTGYLVKDQTAEGLAGGILYFLTSHERRREAGQAGRQRVLEKFEARAVAPK